MASSDDDGDILASVVSDYYFEDSNGKPISFAELPLRWNDDESLDGNQKEIGLHGRTDSGLQRIFEQVTAWNYDISHGKPDIMVLTRKKNWIKLLKPRKSFEKTISKILITVHFLSFVKRKPETSRKALWDHLAKVFSSYDTGPSEDDLMANLIIEAIKQDEILAGSKVLATFLEDKPGKKKNFEEVGTATESSFIVDDVPDENDENGEDGSDDEDEDFFEHICAICDNGGDILCCEGKCLRSFHATKEAGAQSNCISLEFSNEQNKAMANQIFECKNCQYKQHQCFVCGELGSSDESAGAEVFQCVTATCGYFYHPHCVAKALQFKLGDEAKDLGSEIAAGKTFVCPIHTCFGCKEPEPEDKNDLQLQFAVCRRCPRAYHRKCLPGKIAFEEDEEQGIQQRAWEDLMPNKILIYCTKHKIEEGLATPIRNHIKFPGTEGKKKKQPSDSVGKGKVLPKKRDLSLEDAASRNTVGKRLKIFQKSSSKLEQVDLTKTNERRLSMPESSKKQKMANYSKTASKRSPPNKDIKSIGGYSEASLGEQLFEKQFNKDSGLAKPVRGVACDAKEQVKVGRPVSKEASDSVTLDADSKKRIFSFIREAKSRITLEDVIKEHKAPSTHVSSTKNAMQNITLGKVEGSIEVCCRERGYDSYQDDARASRNSLSTEEPYLYMRSRWQYPAGPGSDYSFRAAPDEQFVNYQRDHTSVVGLGAQFGERNDEYGREADIGPQAQFYRNEDPDSTSHRTHYLATPAPGFSSSYRQLGADSEHSSLNTSTMQRYAPRLNEVNTPRMNNVGSVQHLDGRSGFYNTAPRPGRVGGPLGFAPGPYRPYSQHSSSGWLYE